MKIVKKAIAIMIVNDNDEMLLLKRGPGSKYESGLWEQCGGSVEDYESFEEAARREAKEELDISIEIMSELIHDNFSDMGDGIVWEVKLLKAKIIGIPKIMEKEKCVELKWVTKKKLLQMNDHLTTHLKEDLEKLGWI